MISKLLAMTLVACDRRKNPAADLVARCASQALGALGRFVEGASSSSAAAGRSMAYPQNVHEFEPQGKTYKAMTSSGKIVTVYGSAHL